MENKNNVAQVYCRSLPISAKMSMEICGAIRNMELTKAKRILQDVVDMKRALPFRKFNADLSHKPGMAAGRYPISTSKVFLKLLNSVEMNAGNKGLNVNNLVINFAKADRAETRWRSGRKGRVQMKSTHVKIIVGEKTAEKK